jgi:hypothetical protein
MEIKFIHSKIVYNMKKIICLLSILLLAGLAGCGEEGENAPSAAKDLKVYPGKYRAKLEFATPAEAVSYKVFYNNGEYVENPVSNAGDAEDIVIDGLAESEQVLRVIILNGDGTASDPKGIKVNVYGDNYQAKLNPRRLIEQNTLSPTSVELTFEAAEKDETDVYLVFTNTSGVLDSTHISAAQTILTANGIDLNEPYYFYSVYKPEADAIDYFRSATVDAKNTAMFNFEKEKWTIAGFSDEEPGGDGQWALARYIIDDNIATFWHSQIVGAQPPMPHWITVDMRSEKKFDGFYFVQMQEVSETGLAKGFRFEISSDNDTWENVLEGEFTTSRARQEFAFGRQVTARYFKITILSGYADAWWSQFAEIDLYNEINVSGMNGSIKVNALFNAERPFQGENPHSWGTPRFQQLIGWTHDPANILSFDSSTSVNRMTCFTFPAAGIPLVTNGKVYQTVTLQPGNYTLKFLVVAMAGNVGVTAYGVVTTQATLPNIEDLATANALGYVELSELPIQTRQISFTLTATTDVTIGRVYTTANTPQGYASLTIDGIELYKEY